MLLPITKFWQVDQFIKKRQGTKVMYENERSLKDAWGDVELIEQREEPEGFLGYDEKYLTYGESSARR